MRFEFFPHDSLPRLAWCARLRRGRDVVEVRHGPWVETAETWFVEGAWPGRFSAGGVVEAPYFIGTGGRAEPDRVIFSASSNLFDLVHLVRVDDDLYVSNSRAFLLRATDDEPDPGHLYYDADRLGDLLNGLRRRDKRVRTACGRHVRVHDGGDVAIGADLALRCLEKAATPAPRDYAGYVGRLEATIAAVHANAADPARRQRRYRPVANISCGYDSTAAAALARRHGAGEAITFANPGDDGTAIGERLGYVVTAGDQRGFLRLRGAVEAEFHATPPGGDIPIAVFEPQLVGALLVTGRGADLLHGTARPAPPDLLGSSMGALGGAMMSEFRLRVGFLEFDPFYVGALHPEAIHRISVSAEMKPWSVGGVYDRPIARRILEEAGVPREWFGQRKFASGFTYMRRPEEMSPEAAADFVAFLRTRAPITRRQWLGHRARKVAGRLKIDHTRRRLLLALGLQLPRRTIFSPTVFSAVEMGLAVHWGFARIRSRYDAASWPRQDRPSR